MNKNIEQKLNSGEPCFWIARDMDGSLFLYDEEPFFSISNEWFISRNGNEIQIPEQRNPINGIFDLEAGECLCLSIASHKSYALKEKELIIKKKL